MGTRVSLPPRTQGPGGQGGLLGRDGTWLGTRSGGKQGAPGLSDSSTKPSGPLLPGSQQDRSSRLCGWVGPGDWLNRPTRDLGTDPSWGI